MDKPRAWYHETMALSFTFPYFDAEYTVRSLGIDSIPTFEEVIGVHAIPITADGKIVAVQVATRGVDVPGGHVESHDHSPLETLNRELDEEAQLSITRPTVIDVLAVHSNKADLGSKKYLLIYAALVVHMNTFIPTKEITARYILTPDELVEQYFASKEYARQMIDIAMNTLAVQQAHEAHGQAVL